MIFQDFLINFPDFSGPFSGTWSISRTFLGLPALSELCTHPVNNRYTRTTNVNNLYIFVKYLHKFSIVCVVKSKGH